MAVTFTFTIAYPAPVVVNDAVDGGAAEALRDMSLDPITGDLVFRDGDAVFTVSHDAVAQEIKSFCLTFGPGTTEEGEDRPGEWFLDTTIGVNYWGKVFRGSVSEADARGAFSQEIAKVPGVVAVRNVRSSVTERGFELSFDAYDNLGAVISATLAETKDGA